MSERSSPPYGGTEKSIDTDESPGLSRVTFVAAGGFGFAGGGAELTELVKRNFVRPTRSNSPFSSNAAFVAEGGRNVSLEFTGIDLDPKAEDIAANFPDSVSEVMLPNMVKGKDDTGRLDGSGAIPEMMEQILEETEGFENAIKEAISGDPTVVFFWASLDGGVGSGTLRKMRSYINEDHVVDRRLNEPTIVVPVTVIPHHGDALRRRNHPGYASGMAVDNVKAAADLLDEEIGRAFDFAVVADNDFAALAAYSEMEDIPLPKFKNAISEFRKNGNFDGFLGFDDSVGEGAINKSMANHGISNALLPLIEMPLQPENLSFGKVTQTGFDSGDFRSNFGGQIVIPGYASVDNTDEIFDLVPNVPDEGDPFRAAIRGTVHYSQMTSIAPFHEDDVESVTSFVAAPGSESQGVSQLLQNQIRSDFAQSFPDATSITVNNVKGLTAENFPSGLPDVASWTLVGVDQIRSTVDDKWGDI